MCHVALGIVEAYWEYRLKPWDMAAGVLVISPSQRYFLFQLLDVSGRDSYWMPVEETFHLIPSFHCHFRRTLSFKLFCIKTTA